MIRLFIFLVFLVGAEFIFAAQTQNSVEPGPIEHWIKPIGFVNSLPPSSTDAVGGVAYVLVDRQVKVEDRSDTTWFYHNVNYVVAQTGLASASQINLEFDPSYQKIVLNRLVIHRQGEKLDKLNSAKITIIQRETELENQIYDGSLTANINLEDVRVGDFIECAYTLEGANPVFANIYSGVFYAQWATPVQEFSMRLLWLKANPPKAIRVYNSEKSMEHLALPRGHEYRFQATNVMAKMVNSEAPSWFRPYSRVEVSDYAGWDQVVEWANTLYQPLLNSNPTIRELANDIRKHHAATDQQIVAALQLVQGQVRYLGIEMGVGSHKPSAPVDTWARKYGDCKDKSSLLVAILRELGVKAFPALVNSDLRKSIADKLPSPQAFNHVITKVILGDQTYWLDPTRQPQYGPLEGLYQSRYGYALVISQETTALERIEPITISEQRISTEYFLPHNASQPVQMHIQSEFSGREAEKVRYELSNRGLDDLSDSYFNFYKRYFPGLAKVQPLSFQPDTVSGKVTATEKYSVDNFWEKNSSGRWIGTFSADVLLSELKLPEERARNAPYALSFPNQVYQKIQVHLKPGEWNFEKEKNIEANDFFYFKREVEYTKPNNILKFEYLFSAKTDFVPADRIDEYTAAIKKARDFSDYSIYESIESDINEPIEDNFYLYVYWGFVGFCLVVIGIACWLRVRDSRTNAAALAVAFYPVEMWRFLILNTVTLGSYQAYCMWMNWRYVRRRDQLNIVPLARAIFLPIWIFSFWRRVSAGPERHLKPFAHSKLTAILFSCLFVVTIAGSSIEQLGLYQLLFILINLVLAGVLAWQVLNIEQNDPVAVDELSSWKFRHYLVIVAYLPWSIFWVGSTDNLFSGQSVLEKNRISKVCVYYLHQHDVFIEGENPKLFYSAAWGNIFSEGFGVTEHSLFSYWHEAGELQFKKIPLTEIHEVKLAEEENERGDYVISILDSSKNEMQLLVTSTDNNHKAFHRKLMALWKTNKKVKASR